MGMWLGDLRQGARRLARAPVFALTTFAVIATSVGFGSAMTGLTSAIVRQALPYERGGELVRLYEHNQADGIPEMNSSLTSFRWWTESARALETLGAVQAPVNLTLHTPEGTSRLLGGIVSPGLFTTLGVQPMLGRAFGPEEGVVGLATPSVVVSHELWVTRMSGSPDALGSTLTINGSAWTVVGVLPPGMPLDPTVSEPIDAWVALGHVTTLMGPGFVDNPIFRAFNVFARVDPDLSEQELTGELHRAQVALEERHPDSHAGWAWAARPLAETVTEELRGPLIALLVAAGLLFVVAVTNVSALFVQRGREQMGEAAIRMAIGADVSHLRRIAQAEAALLVVPGVLAGLAAGALLVAARDIWMPFPFPPHIDVGTDRGFGVTVLAGGVAAIYLWARLITSWWRRRALAVSSSLRRGGEGVGRFALVGLGLQVSMATVLTVTGLLTLSSIRNLRGADVGLVPDRLLTIRVDVPADSRPDDQVSRTADEILGALRALPRTRDAALWTPHVPAQAVWYSSVRIASRPDLQEDGDLPSVRIHQIGEGAATLLGLEFVEGQDFTSADRTANRRVALVSESAAREWWGGESAVGRRIRRWNHTDWSTVVGVVADAPLSGRQGDGSDFARDVAFLHDQDPQRYLVFLVRVHDDDPAALQEAEQAVRARVPDLPVYGVRFMSDILAEQEQIGRNSATLGSVFALVALGLVALGLYGILSRLIAQSSLEISIRKAIGASTGRILREVTTRAWVACGVGAGVGLLAAWHLIPVLLGESLYAVPAHEPRLYGVALLVLIATAAPAILTPALRGTRASPVKALRSG